MKLWPNFYDDEIEKFPKLKEFMKFIVRERKNDVQEISNLPQLLIQGRKVGKIPANSGDVDSTDKLNDINWDDAYIYILTTVAAVPTWGRAALDTSW